MPTAAPTSSNVAPAPRISPITRSCSVVGSTRGRPANAIRPKPQHDQPSKPPLLVNAAKSRGKKKFPERTPFPMRNATRNHTRIFWGGRFWHPTPGVEGEGAPPSGQAARRGAATAVGPSPPPHPPIRACLPLPPVPADLPWLPWWLPGSRRSRSAGSAGDTATGALPPLCGGFHSLRAIVGARCDARLTPRALNRPFEPVADHGAGRAWAALAGAGRHERQASGAE